jgi:transposase
VRLIAESQTKSDRFDAEVLARLGRIDPDLLSPVAHRGAQAQRDLILIRSRMGLVRARTRLVNQVRGFAKSLGTRLPGCSTVGFPKRVREAAPADLFPGLDELLAMIDQLSREIGRMDRQIERLCDERYPETERLRQVKGVGPVTALAFILTIEDPHRFPRSRTVGAYLGLCPRQRDSGERQPRLGITKAGDGLMRQLLVGAGHYIIGPFGPDTDLRRFGLRLVERGGKAARQRAAVAVARKLAVLLHQLWLSGEDYQPLDRGMSAEGAVA